MRKAGTIEEVKFETGSLIASSTGLFDVYTSNSINGTIQSVVFLDNTHTTTGSYLLFPSGLQNSGTNTGGLILRMATGSSNITVYPYIVMTDNQGIAGSFEAFENQTQFRVNEPLRLVGSGLGNGTSGLGVIIRYI